MVLLRFKPVYQSYLWGGNRLSTVYGRMSIPSPAAESWELSDREEGMSKTEEGKTLRELLGTRFPLLIKLIDARESLSIQVHPNEEAAALLKGEAKSECWVALDTSIVYAGLKSGVKREDLLQGVLPDFLNKHVLKAGEAIYIPAGTVHSIGAGSLIYEVQQNSNTTYRLYDWGRSRPLHLDKGLQSLNFEANPFVCPLDQVFSPYFSLRFVNEGRLAGGVLQTLFCCEGAAELMIEGKKERIVKGESVLITPSIQEVKVIGEVSLIQCVVR